MMLDKYKAILWDFDGVIMDSNPVRTKGFEEVLKTYPDEQVKELIAYHKQNGGLSRYVKFRYFFEKIRGEEVTDDAINKLSASFSEIMLSLLINEKLLIPDTVDFIKSKYHDFEMHIVSGSDQAELRKICRALNLEKYFLSISGSPTPKTELVKQVLASNNYHVYDVCFIGDSVNDYDASAKNGLDFYGYNNRAIENLPGSYIESFTIS